MSVAWALADPETQARIYDAHQQALAHVIRYAEQHVFSSRSGKNGVVQEDLAGVVAAAFDHWDSRTGDPQLHTHVVIMNRVKCVSDGVWRSLDSRGLFKATVAMSELYNGVLADYLTQTLGYGWQPQGRKHSTAPRWEIVGVPESLQAEFSQRSAAIENAADTLIDAFVTTHGRRPSTRGPGSVVGLAPSATAAEVLAEQAGIPTENTAKWLVENTRNAERLIQIDTLRVELHRTGLLPRIDELQRQIKTLTAEMDRWSLHAGQLVIVDEASLAGTFTLDTLVGQARDAGAKVVLVGDWAQLSSVEAGGAFHLLVGDRGDASELSDVRRFTHEWERQTSVDLRIGLPDAADTYQAHGRLEGGDRD